MLENFDGAIVQALHPLIALAWLDQQSPPDNSLGHLWAHSEPHINGKQNMPRFRAAQRLDAIANSVTCGGGHRLSLVEIANRQIVSGLPT